MNHTPIYDIKPYLPYVDSHPDATEGFAAPLKDQQLQVHFPKTLLEKFSPEKQAAAIGILAQDPRPGYDHEDSRIYKIAFAGYDIHFQVQDQLLTVCDLISLEGGSHERQ